jgi:signal transduction histidine kinase
VPEVTFCVHPVAARDVTAHSCGMNIGSRNVLRELLAPLSLAAYLAWGAVWLSLAAPQPPSAAGLLSRASMLLFLFAFVSLDLLASRRRAVAAGIAMALSALTVIALHPNSASPILLVLMAGMLASQLQSTRLLWVLVAINVPFVAIFLNAYGWHTRTWVSLIAYASFQGFAALVMRYAKRSEAMADELRQVNGELLATRSLLSARTRDAERLRLSRELHDVAGHSLTALKLNLAALSRSAAQPDPERVALCANLADDLLQNLRGVVAQMRHGEGIDLQQTIERLAMPFPRPALHLQIDADARVDDIERADALLRTVQEGLTNAARHSNAANLWVVLQRDGERLRLELRDDGRGSTRLRPGNGLSGMRERLQALGGDLDIEHADGQGVRLHAWLPAEQAG